MIDHFSCLKRAYMLHIPHYCMLFSYTPNLTNNNTKVLFFLLISRFLLLCKITKSECMDGQKREFLHGWLEGDSFRLSAVRKPQPSEQSSFVCRRVKIDQIVARYLEIVMWNQRSLKCSAFLGEINFGNYQQIIMIWNKL